MVSPTVKLNTGAEIPVLGFGTWQLTDVANAVSHALKAGYRHIDCAWAYANEEEVGRGIKASGVPREEIFITSKVWCTHHSRVEESLDYTLKKLGTDYIDLYLVHWPLALHYRGKSPEASFLPDAWYDVDHSWDINDTWKQMEKIFRAGKAKAIGVSNFSQMKLEEILPTAEIKPAVDQLELHLWNPEHNLLKYLNSQNIIAQAYSPLGSSDAPLLSDETALAVSKKYNVGVVDVLIGYLIAKNIVTLPKSNTPARITSNLVGPLNFAKCVDKTDLATLDGVAANGKQKRFLTPPWPIELGLENWPAPNADHPTTHNGDC